MEENRSNSPSENLNNSDENTNVVEVNHGFKTDNFQDDLRMEDEALSTKQSLRIDELKQERTYNRMNSSNLVQDEMLIGQVKKYPCLYDRFDDDYKNPVVVGEAWKEIIQACDWLKHPDEGSRLFEVLKKRYSKKKMDFKRAHIAPGSTPLMIKTEAELNKYNFMSWMEPYIRFRSVKLTNDNSTKNDHAFIINKNEQVPEEQLISHFSSTPIGQIKQNRKRSYEKLSEPEHIEFSTNYKNRTNLIINKPPFVNEPRLQQQPHPPLQQSYSVSFSPDYQYHHGNEKHKISDETLKLHHMIEAGRANGTKEPSGNAQDSASRQLKSQLDDKKDNDELFSAMLVSELRKLEGKKKYIVKHKITNILFDALIEQCDETGN